MQIPSGDANEEYSDEYCNMLLTYCSNYDYKKSKFAKGDALSLYDKHVRGALLHTAKVLSSEDGEIFSLGTTQHTHVVRDAYAGALCSYQAKKRIEVDYCSFVRSYELRFIVSDIVKYSENRLRAYLGVKSRLTVSTIPKNVKACVDEYFDSALPRRSSESESWKESVEQDYYRFYDAPASPISSERAAEIEAESWQTTERLIAAFDEELSADDDITDEKIESAEDNIESPQLFYAAEKVVAEKSCGGGFADLLGELFEFVRLAELKDAAAQRRFAAERHEMVDYIADRINEIATEVIGDVILEDCGGYYSFIEDYRKEVFE